MDSATRPTGFGAATAARRAASCTDLYIRVEAGSAIDGVNGLIPAEVSHAEPSVTDTQGAQVSVALLS